MNLDDHVLSLSNILTRIDEYGLYCHYLGFDPDIRGTYSSPIREIDDKPSFSFYNAYPGTGVEFMWKDGALKKSGTIVQLLEELYGITYTEALKKIDADFKLGFTDGNFKVTKKFITNKRPVQKEKATIEVNSRINFTPAARQYWDDYYISELTLEKYNVTQLYGATINSGIVSFKNLTFSYRIADKYKIYTPGVDKFRFLNNYSSRFVEGFDQLENKSDTLIITKSMKDIMVLYELGYESIGPRSETTMIPKQYFKWIDANYKKVIVLFDNDMKHNGEDYPYVNKHIPLESGCKDISDYIKMYGTEDTLSLIKTLLK